MKWESVEPAGFPEVLDGPFFGLLVLAAFLGWQVFRAYKSGFGTRRPIPWADRRTTTWKPATNSVAQKVAMPDMADPQQQLRAISMVNFEKQRLMNLTEYRVLQVLERVVSQHGKGHRIMAQTSLGELIQPNPGFGTEELRKQAYASINSKRLDFAIVDKFGLLTSAIEVQGSGHYHQKTFLRDAVKREALRRAGVDLIEIQKSWTEEEIANRVAKDLLATVTP